MVRRRSSGGYISDELVNAFGQTTAVLGCPSGETVGNQKRERRTSLVADATELGSTSPLTAAADARSNSGPSTIVGKVIVCQQG